MSQPQRIVQKILDKIERTVDDLGGRFLDEQDVGARIIANLAEAAIHVSYIEPLEDREPWDK